MRHRQDTIGLVRYSNTPYWARALGLTFSVGFCLLIFTEIVSAQGIFLTSAPQGIVEGEVYRLNVGINVPEEINTTTRLQVCIRDIANVIPLSPKCMIFFSDRRDFTFQGKMLLRNADPETMEIPVLVSLLIEGTVDTLATLRLMIPILRPSVLKLQETTAALIFSEERQSAELGLRIAGQHVPSRFLRMEIRSPAGISTFPKSMRISSDQPFDTLISLKVEKDDIAILHDDVIALKILDEHDSILLSRSIPIVSQESNWRVPNPRSAFNTGEYVDFRIQRNARQSDRAYFSGRAKNRHKGGVDQFRIHSLYNISDERFWVSNTSYRINKNAHRLELGNLYQRGEAALFGRGIKYNVEKGNQKASIAYFNGAANLLHNGWAGSTATGNSFVGSYEFINKKGSALGGQYVHQRRKNFVNNFYELSSSRVGSKNRWEGRATLVNTAQDLDPSEQLNYSAFSTEFNFNHNSENWSVTSENYYSSPRFSGLQRGLTLLNERVQYRISPLWDVELNALFQRRKENDLIRIVDPTSLHFVPTGTLRFRLKKGVTLMSSFYKLRQRSNRIDFSMEDNFFSTRGNHGRLQLQINKGPTLFNISFDMGRHNLIGPDQEESKLGFLESRLILNHKSFNLIASYRRGAYYLYEQFQEIELGLKKSFLILAPRIRFPVLKDILFVTGQSFLNFNFSRSTTSQNWLGRIEYKATNRLTLFGGLGLVNVGGFKHINWNLQGRMSFATNTTGVRKRNVTIQLFFDINGNKVKDMHELPIVGAAVKINNHTLYTSVAGQVEILQLPIGTYQVEIYDLSGIAFSHSREIHVTQHGVVQIPLERASSIIGRVTNKSDKFDLTTIPMSRLNVVAEGAEGAVFRSYVDREGRYKLLLPAGSYLLNVEAGALTNRLEVLGGSRKVKVDGAAPLEEDFMISSKDRSLKIKRF